MRYVVATSRVDPIETIETGSVQEDRLRGSLYSSGCNSLRVEASRSQVVLVSDSVEHCCPSLVV